MIFLHFLFYKHFSICKTEQMMAILSSKWKWAWRAWFMCHNLFFSKISVTFLDVWMILIELFDILVSFRFQNFPRTNFSRYGGLYGLSKLRGIISLALLKKCPKLTTTIWICTQESHCMSVVSELDSQSSDLRLRW